MAKFNGEGYNHATMTLSMYGNDEVFGFKAIEITPTRNKNNTKAAQGKVIERTRGDEDYVGSVSITLKDALLLRTANKNRPLTFLPPGNIVVTLANSVDPARVIVIQYAEFTTDPTSSSSGDAEVTVQLSFMAADIIYL